MRNGTNDKVLTMPAGLSINLAEEVPGAPEISGVPRRRRRIFMVIAVLVIVIVVASAGIGLYALRGPNEEEPSPTPTSTPTPTVSPTPAPTPTPNPYETYSKYGFSIEYPKYMSITEEGWFDETANDNSGSVSGRVLVGQFEEFVVYWGKRSTPATRGSLERTLEEIFNRNNFKKTGPIVETSKSGHDLIYQQGTFTEHWETEYLVYGVWYCNSNEKLYAFMVGQTTEQNLLQVFERYLDSFVCH